jgi:hypothetical protein
MSTLTPKNVNLIWEDIDNQVAAGFVRLVKPRDLFGPNQTPNLKISRVAVVPQTDHRWRIILNLSAEVDDTQQKPYRQQRRFDFGTARLLDETTRLVPRIHTAENITPPGAPPTAAPQPNA